MKNMGCLRTRLGSENSSGGGGGGGAFKYASHAPILSLATIMYNACKTARYIILLLLLQASLSSPKLDV